LRASPATTSRGRASPRSVKITAAGPHHTSPEVFQASSWKISLLFKYDGAPPLRLRFLKAQHGPVSSSFCRPGGRELGRTGVFRAKGDSGIGDWPIFGFRLRALQLCVAHAARAISAWNFRRLKKKRRVDTAHRYEKPDQRADQLARRRTVGRENQKRTRSKGNGIFRIDQKMLDSTSRSVPVGAASRRRPRAAGNCQRLDALCSCFTVSWAEGCKAQDGAGRIPRAAAGRNASDELGRCVFRARHGAGPRLLSAFSRPHHPRK